MHSLWSYRSTTFDKFTYLYNPYAYKDINMLILPEVLIFVLICISLVINDVQHFLLSWLNFGIPSFLTYMIKSIVHF